VIISRGRRYVFVHIPKTGGTSLALALEARAMKDDIMLGDTPKARNRRSRVRGKPTRGRLWKHSTLADIDGLVGGEEIAQMFTFTLVRNPWNRQVSYYHWLRDQAFDHPAVGLARSLDFAGFLSRPEIQSAMRQTPASSYMRRADGQEQANAYIRLEHFAQDVVPLAAHLGFDLALPHDNRSDRAADYRGYYTDALQDIVAQCCAEDIARFGYRF
jgi:hypothetical protein